MTPARRLQSIETKRARLLDRVGAMEPSRLTARPRPGKWSILEIVEHLVICEGTAFSDPVALAALPPLRRRPKHWFLFPVVMFVLRFDIPVQAPSKVLLPSGSASLDQLRARWEANHAGLRHWLGGATRERLAQRIFSHPIGGPMRTAQMLWMVEVHLDRHIRQIDTLERLIDRAGTAAPGTFAEGATA